MERLRWRAKGHLCGEPLPELPHEAQARAFAQDLTAWALHRIDAWGVALIICLVALQLHTAVSLSTLFLSTAMATAYWLAYAVNDYFDAPLDAQDKAKGRRNFFVNHPISSRTAGAGFLTMSGILLLIFAQFSRKGVLLLGIFLFVAWAYSAPPLRLKSRPGLDLLTHALFVQTFPYFFCLTLIDAVWSSLDGTLLAVNFFASLSGQLAQQGRDFAVDSRTDVNFTTTVGRETSTAYLRVVTFVLVLLTVVGLFNKTIPLTFAPIALTFLPAAVHRLHRAGRPMSPRVIYASTTVALLYTGCLLFLGLLRL